MSKDWDFERRTLEANEEDDAVAWAENNGWEVRKIKYVGRNGAPDRFFFGYGTIVMIEFKRPKGTGAEGKLRPDQVKEHDRLAAVGLTVHVCHTKDEAMLVLMEHML